jgi:small neutral amino acid transporter SnatA (MarC family)
VNGILAALLVMVAAWNPALLAERAPALDRRRWTGSAIATAVVLAIAAFTQPVLDVLGVTVPTFRTAAGAVIALTGARWLMGPAPQPDEGDPRMLGTIDVATPSFTMAAMATAVATGWVWSAVGAALAALGSLALQRSSAADSTVKWLRRGTAGLAVAVGVALIYAGIRSV